MTSAGGFDNCANLRPVARFPRTKQNPNPLRTTFGYDRPRMVSEDDSRQRAFAVTQRLAAFVRQHDIGSTNMATYERTDGFVAPVQGWISLPEAEEIYTADI